LYGAALTAEQTGDKQAAQQFYAKLATQTEKADAASRDEVKRIREYPNKVASAN
jgi:hypothetical protein